MKKIILTAAFAIGAMTAINAQETENKRVAMNETEVQAPVEAQDDFTAIKAEKLPQAVKDALAKDFKGATLAKAFVNENDEYKLVITTAEKADKTLYANSDGEWIKKTQQ